MSVRNVQIRTILSGLMATASLLSTVHANPVEKSLAGHDQRRCGALSPLFLALGDAYFDLANTSEKPVESPEAIEQNELLSRLTSTRFSDGTGYRVLCKGSADQVRAELHDVSLEDIEARQTRFPERRQTKMPSRKNTILVTAYEYDDSLRHLTRESVTIPTHPDEMLHLAEQQLVSSSRHRQVTRKGSYLRETWINAYIEDDTITIDQSIYVNGTLALWNVWQLSD